MTLRHKPDPTWLDDLFFGDKDIVRAEGLPVQLTARITLSRTSKRCEISTLCPVDGGIYRLEGDSSKVYRPRRSLQTKLKERLLSLTLERPIGLKPILRSYTELIVDRFWELSKDSPDIEIRRSVTILPKDGDPFTNELLKLRKDYEDELAMMVLKATGCKLSDLDPAFDYGEVIDLERLNRRYQRLTDKHVSKWRCHLKTILSAQVTQ